MRPTAIYIPDNPGLDAVLADLPGPLKGHLEHAQLFVHFVAVKRWMNRTGARGFARLNRGILREYIPARRLTPIKAHLETSGALETSGYSAGARSIGYRIAKAFDGSPRRVVLTHPDLIRKCRAWRDGYATRGSKDDDLAEVLARRREVLDHMRADLGRLSLSRAIEEILRDGGVDADHARYVCQVILNADHETPKVDAFGWRVHSLMTYIAKVIRRTLRIDGRAMAEVDVANAQPLLLAIVFQEWTRASRDGNVTRAPSRKRHSRTTYELSAPHNGVLAPPPGSLAASEVAGFLKICASGKLYQWLMEKSGCENRARVKTAFMTFLCGPPRYNSRVREAFRSEWPSLDVATARTKEQHGQDIIAQQLQRLESTIMIDGVAARLVREHPEVSFLTIHDAASVATDSAALVKQVVVEEFERFGVTPTVRCEPEAPGAPTLHLAHTAETTDFAKTT